MREDYNSHGSARTEEPRWEIGSLACPEVGVSTVKVGTKVRECRILAPFLPTDVVKHSCECDDNSAVYINMPPPRKYLFHIVVDDPPTLPGPPLFFQRSILLQTKIRTAFLFVFLCLSVLTYEVDYSNTLQRKNSQLDLWQVYSPYWLPEFLGKILN